MAPNIRELTAPGHTALILQEVQEGVVGEQAGLAELAAAAREIGLVPKCERLAGAAHGVAVPVVHCTAESLPGAFGANRNARLFAGARKKHVIDSARTDTTAPAGKVFEPGDIVLPRYHGLSPLTGTQLDSLLRNQGVSTVVVAGVSLNVAIPNLVFDAINRSYQVVVVKDAVAGVPHEYGQQVLSYTIGFLATLVSCDELISCWSGRGQRLAGTSWSRGTTR
jgi:nicotinamidase-related amidase